MTPPKENNPTETERLYFQMDNLLHARINIFLLCEAIFLAATATVIDSTFPFFLLCFSGIGTTVTFFIANLRLELRVKWLIQKLKLKNTFFKDYLELKDMKIDELKPFEVKIVEKVSKNERLWRYNPSAPLTWVLFYIFLIAWLLLFLWKIICIFCPSG